MTITFLGGVDKKLIKPFQQSQKVEKGTEPIDAISIIIKHMEDFYPICVCLRANSSDIPGKWKSKKIAPTNDNGGDGKSLTPFRKMDQHCFKGQLKAKAIDVKKDGNPVNCAGGLKVEELQTCMYKDLYTAFQEIVPTESLNVLTLEPLSTKIKLLIDELDLYMKGQHAWLFRVMLRKKAIQKMIDDLTTLHEILEESIAELKEKSALEDDEEKDLDDDTFVSTHIVNSEPISQLSEGNPDLSSHDDSSATPPEPHLNSDDTITIPSEPHPNSDAATITAMINAQETAKGLSEGMKQIGIDLAKAELPMEQIKNKYGTEVAGAFLRQMTTIITKQEDEFDLGWCMGYFGIYLRTNLSPMEQIKNKYGNEVAEAFLTQMGRIIKKQQDESSLRGCMVVFGIDFNVEATSIMEQIETKYGDKVATAFSKRFVELIKAQNTGKGLIKCMRNLDIHLARGSSRREDYMEKLKNRYKMSERDLKEINDHWEKIEQE